MGGRRGVPSAESVSPCMGFCLLGDVDLEDTVETIHLPKAY